MERFRCDACGNITRFDVEVVEHSKAFYHFGIGGELDIEDLKIIDRNVVEITCRWCGHGKAISKFDDAISVTDPGALMEK
ncbi:MAG: hypothetical protein HKL80_03905 [Acidimicrobiales bacterium]|nr:hypothetical protein [Acidimicrobiales bacterium]